jgi:hypothetical protein
MTPCQQPKWSGKPRDAIIDVQSTKQEQIRRKGNIIMANLRAQIFSDRRDSTASRLSSKYISTRTATWKTFVNVHLNEGGSGNVEIEQNGKTIHTYDIPAENAEAVKKVA